MEIEVTQEDIEKGQRHRSLSCPVALAVNRAFNGGSIYVGSSHIYDENDGMRTIDLPIEAISFIRVFDSGKVVKPFKFSIEV